MYRTPLKPKPRVVDVVRTLDSAYQALVQLSNDPTPTLRFDKTQWDQETARNGGVAPMWDWKKPSPGEYCQAIDDYLAGNLRYDDLRERMTYSREYCRIRNIGGRY